MLTFKSGCVELFAILGIGVKQIMKLEPEDKASSFPSLPLPSPEPSLPQLVSSRAKSETGASSGEWPLQPFPSRSGWGSRGKKCQRETLLSFKGPPGWDGDFWKGKVESGDMGRGRYVPGMLGRRLIMEDGSSKGKHPHSKSSCRRETSGAAETGFLAPAQVAWAGSADLQSGIWTWHHLGIPRLPAT